MEVVMEVVRETVSEREKEDVMETVRETLGEMETPTVAATVAPEERVMLTLTPVAKPAEREVLTDVAALPVGEMDTLRDKPAPVGVMLTEEVPEQTLRARLLVKSEKTRVGPPAPVGEKVPMGTTSTSAGAPAVF